MRTAALVLLVACGTDNPKATAPGSPAPPASRRPDTALGLALPSVSAHGYEPAQLAPTVVAVTSRAIVVDGKTVATVANGDVVPEDKQGGARGLEIPRLSTILGSLPRTDELQLALDKDATYRLLIEVMFSAKQKEAGWNNFGVLALAGDKLVRVPLRRPDEGPTAASVDDLDSNLEVVTTGFDRAAVATQIEKRYLGDLEGCYQEALKAHPELGGRLLARIVIDGKGSARGIARGPDPALVSCVEGRMKRWTFDVPAPGRSDVGASLNFEFGLHAASQHVALLAPSPRLIVSVSKQEILVWSVSGDEGSLREPKLKIAVTDASALAKLSSTLAEVVARRWPTGQRPDEGDSIILQADSAVPMHVIAPILGAVRATPNGQPLFPNINLSTGFE